MKQRDEEKESRATRLAYEPTKALLAIVSVGFILGYIFRVTGTVGQAMLGLAVLCVVVAVAD